MSHSTPPILLANADYYGTLAAARCLGRHGVPIVVAEPRWIAPARWSRFATRRSDCPPPEAPERFIEWLLAYGKRSPGHVLYATSDEVAWLFAVHRDELSRHFAMYQPDAQSITTLLDKRRLLALCDALGIDGPQTYCPAGATDEEADRELERLVLDRQLPVSFPLLVKPTMQVLPRVHLKGALVHTADTLVASYRAFRGAMAYHPMLLAHVPTARRPMLQAYHPQAANGIYTIAGFADDAGRITALAARKVLQRPRKLGIGLCFEAAPLRPELVDALSALCQRAGYFGVFEAEFIEVADRFLLIDFNPRFYSQMAFEADRGLPLPLIAYEAALGRFDALASARRRLHGAPPRAAYVHRVIFELLTRGQRLFGRMSAAEARQWHAWRRAHAQQLTDAVLDASDWLPAMADVASMTYGYCRHPRAFVRSILLDR